MSKLLDGSLFLACKLRDSSKFEEKLDSGQKWFSKLQAYAFTCQHLLRRLFEPSHCPRVVNFKNETTLWKEEQNYALSLCVGKTIYWERPSYGLAYVLDIVEPERIMKNWQERRLQNFQIISSKRKFLESRKRKFQHSDFSTELFDAFEFSRNRERNRKRKIQESFQESKQAKESYDADLESDSSQLSSS